MRRADSDFACRMNDTTPPSGRVLAIGLARLTPGRCPGVTEGDRTPATRVSTPRATTHGALYKELGYTRARPRAAGPGSLASDARFCSPPAAIGYRSSPFR